MTTPIKNSDKLEALFLFFTKDSDEGSFRDICLKTLKIPVEIYDRRLQYAISNFVDTISDIQDELHTEELLAEEEQLFMDDYDLEYDGDYSEQDFNEE